MQFPRIDRFLTVRVVSPLLPEDTKDAPDAVPILMYHSISDDREPGISPYYRLATPPSLFKQHLDLLHQDGFQVISLLDAIHSLTRSRHTTRKPVVITFDDGFHDFLLEAWPILSASALPATVFLPTSYISETRKTFVGRDCLTWSEVRQLRLSGVHFGSHTDTHPKLVALKENRLREELLHSRLELEQNLQESITSFCHPYGFPSADARYVSLYRRLLAECGYSIAVTTIVGRATLSSDPLMLPRIPVNGADDLALFAAKLRGAYDWTATVQTAFKHAKRLFRPLS
jgi:peptidoglycan/xylan/chitin deacetylase (PgdA/CDA1 family)